MSTTGDIIAGTGTSVARGAGTAWTNPGNITANDGTVASCTGGASGSAYLRASNFGFTIPANSLIQGFTVKVDMAESSAGTETVSVQIVNAAGSPVGTAKTFVASGTTLVVYTTGSGTDLWGTTGLTATDINDTDFGVYVWYTTSHNTTVDYISIDVNYEPPISGSLAVTESGSDTASINGDVIVQGSLSVTETGSDTLAINGTVGNAAITGSLAATEIGSDTASISGDVFISGSLAATETGSDTAVITGNIPVTGSLSATETGVDSASIAGLVLIQGSLSATETGNDTANINGNVIGAGITGSLAAVEIGSDTALISGVVIPFPITGTLAANETGFDTASFAQIVAKEKPIGGGSLIRMSASRRDLKSAAQKMLRLLHKPIVKNTLKLSRVTKKLEEVTEQVRPREETVEKLADQAIAELRNQQRVVKNVEDARKIRVIIEDLKEIKKKIDDDEEALMVLFG